MTSLEDLWYGNVNPNEAILTENRRYKAPALADGQEPGRTRRNADRQAAGNARKVRRGDERNALPCGGRGICLRLPTRHQADDRDGCTARKRNYITHSGGIAPAADPFT